MKKISTLQLTPGMIIGENVLSYDRQIVLAKGTELTDVLITRLELYGVLSVYIDDSTATADTEHPYLEPSPKKPSHSDRIRASAEFKAFKAAYEDTTQHFKSAISDMVSKNKKIDTAEIIRQPMEMLASADNSLSILDMLQNMREYDDSTFAHSMNVALLNYVAAGWLNWSKADQEMALTCGLFHDIGKLQIDHKILTKPGKLDATEYDHIKKHPILGYKLLLKQDVNDHVRYAALMHHERYDGTGYPLQVKGEKIDRFALLTAVSDVYDAMTAARVYRGPLCPFRVIEIFEDEGLEKYEPEIILSFLKNVGNTYIQNGCVLSDGREGDIVMLNSIRLSRPVVQCGFDYVDLSKTPNLRIENLR